MQNICRLLAAGERNAHPIEAMSSVVALFLLVFCFSSLLNSVSEWECVTIRFCSAYVLVLLFASKASDL